MSEPAAAPERVADTRCELGEAPFWHAEEKRLYWLDCLAGRVLRFDPASGRNETLRAGGMIGGFTVEADGALLLFMEEGAVRRWTPEGLTTLRATWRSFGCHRFNDVVAEPRGSVLCGAIAYQEPLPELRGAPLGFLMVKVRRRLRRHLRALLPERWHRPGLYRLEAPGALARLDVPLGFANGMGFSPDRKQFYLSDSERYEILRYDYDAASGALSERGVFARLTEAEGRPDGLTVDSEGRVWSARSGGGCVVRYDAEGAVERRIEIPARRVTSLTFGGEGYRDLYVTTAGGEDRATEGPGAGALFRLRPGVAGLPEFRSRIACGGEEAQHAEGNS